ncbi:hypothetical protein PoB_002217100 [Plakobranchus ocellatus]|uniref:Uncharacterized protein n=1 Tax=Plakobranchus ocellatus TaxID=259542 RepID=A0AAV3ZMB9_9GAST|nr:hypothetical protein PoB_002217100 [Plakobranchus ocellatus]
MSLVYGYPRALVARLIPERLQGGSEALEQASVGLLAIDKYGLPDKVQSTISPVYGYPRALVARLIPERLQGGSEALEQASVGLLAIDKYGLPKYKVRCLRFMAIPEPLWHDSSLKDSKEDLKL